MTVSSSASAQETPSQDPTFAGVLIPEMEQVFAETQGMIDHTHTVLGHALDIQGQEGEILTKHRFPPDQVDHICGIVANHHSDADPEIVTTLEFKILWDADWLVNFPGRHREATE